MNSCVNQGLARGHLVVVFYNRGAMYCSEPPLDKADAAVKIPAAAGPQFEKSRRWLNEFGIRASLIPMAVLNIAN